MTISPYTKLMLDAIADLGSLTGKSCLDVGCGRGYLGEALLQLGGNVLGIDVRDDAVAASIARGVPAMRLDMRDIPLVIGTSYDIVVANLPALRCLGSIQPNCDEVIYCGGITGRANVVEFLHLLPIILKPHGYALVILSSMNDMRRQIEEARAVGEVTLLNSAVVPIRDELYASMSNCRYLGEIRYTSFLKKMERLDPPMNGDLGMNNSYVRGEGNEHIQVIKVER